MSALLASLAAWALSHPASPRLVSAVELEPGLWAVSAPASLAVAPGPECDDQGLWRCHDALAEVRFAPATQPVLCRRSDATGRVQQRFVAAGAAGCRFDVGTASSSPGPSLGSALLLGCRHLASGLDHLAFLLGLFALVGPRRQLVWVATAFTAGHSVTLALQVLQLAAPNPRVVEGLIAVSLVLLARELMLQRRERAGLGVAAGFGLVHGFGLAGALQALQLEGANALRALLGFNLGVELGQLAVLGGLVAVTALVRRIPGAHGVPWRHTAARLIGAGGVYWACARLL